MRRPVILGSALAILLSSISAGTAAAQSEGEWRDPYIDAPRNLVATAIDSCRHQLSFERDHVDSRYPLAFEAEFRAPDGRVTARAVAAENGAGLAYPERTITSGSRYDLGNGYALAPFQVDVCPARQAGESLVGLRLLARLPEGGYNYRNDYRSPRIAVSATLPGTPVITRAERVSGTDGLRLTWSAVAGAPTYRVMVSRPVYFGGDITWDHRIAATDVTGTGATVALGSYRPDLDRRIVVTALSGGRASDTAAVGEITVRP